MIYAHGKVGTALRQRFPCKSLTTGLMQAGISTGSFTVVLLNDSDVLQSAPTVSEVGYGWYAVSFTPGATGRWALKISQASMQDVALEFLIESQEIGDVAPAATALSTAQWTNLRAANLDLLDVAISTVNTAVGAVSTAVGTVNTAVTTVGTAVTGVNTAVTKLKNLLIALVS